MDILIPLEKKALEKYQSAISLERKKNDIVSDIAQCAEFLFKSICVVTYNELETSRAIDEPIVFLDRGRHFFGKMVSGKFQPNTFQLGIIKKNSEFINSRINPEKHSSYDSTDEDVIGAIAAVRSILKWYFKDYCDYNKLHLTNEEKNIITNLFNNDLKNYGILSITQDYWDALYTTWIEKKKHVYENFFLRTDEGYIHPFIAIAAKENKDFFDFIFSYMIF